ncbi:unnamed protein product [Prunus armeniaca]
MVGHLCTKYRYTTILKATRNREAGQPPVHSNRASGWGNHCRTIVYTQISKADCERGNWPTTCVVILAGGWEIMVEELAVYCTCTRKFLKEAGNGETSQPPAQSNQAVGKGNLCQTSMYQVQGKVANHLRSHIKQVAREIIIGYLCIKYKYTQIAKGNWKRGNWSTTCAIKSGKWMGKSLSDTCTKYRYTQISKADCERENWPTTCAVISGRQLGMGKLANDLCSQIGQPTGNGETSQPPVQSNQAGDGKSLSNTYNGNWEREKWPTTCSQIRQLGTGNWPTTCAIKSGRWLRKSLSDTCIKYKYTRISKGTWERRNWPTTCALKLGRWLRKSLSNTCIKYRYTRTSKGNWK